MSQPVDAKTVIFLSSHNLRACLLRNFAAVRLSEITGNAYTQSSVHFCVLAS